MPVTKFTRLRYANDSELNSMIDGGFAASIAPRFDEELKTGMGLLLANFDEDSQHAVVRALGIVKGKRANNRGWEVEWIRVTEFLYPTPEGMIQWRKVKPYFKFDREVAGRYGLVGLFDRYFPHLPNSTVA